MLLFKDTTKLLELQSMMRLFRISVCSCWVISRMLVQAQRPLTLMPVRLRWIEIYVNATFEEWNLCCKRQVSYDTFNMKDDLNIKR